MYIFFSHLICFLVIIIDVNIMFQDVIRKQLLAIESDPLLEIHEKQQRKQALLQTVLNSATNNSSGSHFGGPLESIVGTYRTIHTVRIYSILKNLSLRILNFTPE